MTESESHCPFCALPLQPGSAGGLCPRCSLDAVLQKEEETLETRPGFPQIEGIELQAEIGEGGFGIVYRAHQTGMVRRKVALKVLKPGVDTRQVLRRFEVERQALAHLEHPGIARFYEAGQTKEGYSYFTMELIEGVPINEAIGGQNLTEVISLFLQVCESVAHAHDQGILHRDLKPGNILVTPAGAPKVIDFGLAKALDAEQAPGMTLYTGGGSWLGTPGYAAPEQLNASEIQLDERVDVFSLGAILYHLVTGMNPEDAREIGVNANELPLPSEIALQKVEAGLDAIIMHAISPKREDRYRSVREFMADLRRHLNGDPLTVQSPKAKSLKTLIIIGITILIIGLILAWSSYDKPRQTTSSEEPIQSLKNDYQNFEFKNMGFITLDEDSPPIAPFPGSRNFCWVKFRKPDGSEFILSYDSLYSSPTVSQFYIGGKLPNEPGVRVIPIDSDEDKTLVKFFSGLRETTIGADQAEELENTEWADLPKGENAARIRLLKKLLGSIWFFENQRHLIKEAKSWE